MKLYRVKFIHKEGHEFTYFFAADNAEQVVQEVELNYGNVKSLELVSDTVQVCKK